MRAFVFPGQGSQKVGMGAELAAASPAAREVFEEVDDALGQKLFQIMTQGPDDALTLTENAQPAIMAHAIAVLRVLEKEGGIALADKADFVAGHSLGEYTALCAAGAFRWPIPRACSSCAGNRCRLPCRWAKARWRAAGRRYRQGDGARGSRGGR
jgi:malonyl CoA-acyl carrier protein transacylase